MLHNCLSCHNDFDADYRQRYCSKKCSGIAKSERAKEFCHCAECGKEFVKKNKKQKFCSIQCSSDYTHRVYPKVISAEQRKKISLSLKEWHSKHVTPARGEKLSRAVGSAVKTGRKPKSILDMSSRSAQKIMRRLNIGCSVCGWNESGCDIHHINGRRVDNADGHWNLSYLCPNCHRLAGNGKIKKEDLVTLDKTLPSNWDDYYYG